MSVIFRDGYTIYCNKQETNIFVIFDYCNHIFQIHKGLKDYIQSFSPSLGYGDHYELALTYCFSGNFALFDFADGYKLKEYFDEVDWRYFEKELFRRL